MKKSLLEIVQEIMSDLDSDDVNSISDSVEAGQVASIVETTYRNLITTREIPEHQQLLKLTALSDTSFPTHFEYPTNTKSIEKVWYENADGDYQEVCFIEPMEFLERTDDLQSDYETVTDKNGGTKLRVGNTDDPTFYTTFDDKYIVMNSRDSVEDTTLQESKVRAWGTIYPTFTQSDSFVPDLDASYFPYFIAEAKSAAGSLLKGFSDPKVEQAARRQKSFLQSNKHNSTRKNKWSSYGR